MRIEPTQNLITGLDAREHPLNKPDAIKNNNIPPQNVQGDRIDISLNSALSIAKTIMQSENLLLETKLTPDRISEIQNRAKSGFYGTEHVLGQATEGILELYSD